MDDNLKAIERRLGVEISYRGHEFTVVGMPVNCKAVVNILKSLYLESQEVKGNTNLITPEMVHLAILDADCLEQASSLDSKALSQGQNTDDLLAKNMMIWSP
jgi:phosphate starvation-inducible PhoH-like protein